MVESHQAIKGSTTSLRQIKRALLSVSDKTDLISFGKFLASEGVEILSTGGTAAALRKEGITVIDVSDYTKSPEILNGRVKTLHPKVHGGILAVRGNEEHEKEVVEHGIGLIDLVVINLYPFEQTVKSGAPFEQCVENIDIGGPAMLRAAAKNFQSVVVVTAPAQYALLQAELGANGMSTTMTFRRDFAATAFNHSSNYDTLIANYFLSNVQDEKTKQAAKETGVTRVFRPELKLKYGCNPNQTPAYMCTINASGFPFKVLSGTPGYINFMDALNAWQLVKEVKEQLKLPAAASFKHCSPAGAAVSVEFTEAELDAYELRSKVKELTPLSISYIRARQADPMSSFGDFIALSDKVDIATANIIKSEVSDGIIAPGYEPEAYEILKAKKGGKFIVLEMDYKFEPSQEVDFREVYGVAFAQHRNDCVCDAKTLQNVVTNDKSLPEEAKRDLILGNIAIKYTQSNSVGFVRRGQMIGIGAGQQSRVDCVKLCGKKALVWFLRQHPRVLALKFREGVKKQDRVNARVRFIELSLQSHKKSEKAKIDDFYELFQSKPEWLQENEVDYFLAKVNEEKNVGVVSDAFFPFRDNIDVCAELGFGVKYVAQTGGSVQDDTVITACNEYGMVMAFTGQRLFHH